MIGIHVSQREAVSSPQNPDVQLRAHPTKRMPLWLKTCIIGMGLMGAAVVHAQTACPASSVALTWNWAGQLPFTCATGVPAQQPSGAYASVPIYQTAGAAATVASLQAQNAGCTAIFMNLSWVGTGAGCGYTQLSWTAGTSGSSFCPTSSLLYSASSTGHVGPGYNMYLQWAVQDASCFPGAAYGGSAVIASNKTDGAASSAIKGEPVGVSTGNVFITQADYSPNAFGALNYQRYYNSDPAVPTGRLGAGWRDTFDRMVVMSNQLPTSSSYTGTPIAFVYRPDGRIVTFYVSGGIATATDPDTTATLSIGCCSNYTYTDDDNTVESYTIVSGSSTAGPNYYGQLSSIRYLGGETLSLTYTSYSGVNAFLTKVADSFGHTLTFVPDGTHALVSTMTDKIGNVFNYTYNARGYLANVYYPGPTIGSLTGAPLRQYTYTAVSSKYALTGIIDENGNQSDTWTYDTTTGRALSNYRGSSQSLYGFTYSGTAGAGTTVVDGAGVSEVYSFTVYNGIPKVTSIVTNGTTTRSAIYASSGRVTSETDPVGNNTTRAYNTRGLETSRTEGVGSTSVRTIVTTWNATYQLPLTISTYANATGTGTASQTLTYTYDGYGNVLTKTVADPAYGTSRKWTYTYDNTNNNGHLLTELGPRTDVVNKTTYTYYSCTTGSQCGQLDTITDANGRITTVTAYNADGLPTSITDANSLITTLAYDPQNRVTNKTVGTESSSVSYTAAGQIYRVTLPDGAYVQMTYDTAHRLTQVLDGLGNTLVYAYSPMGIRTTESEYDPSSYLNRTLSRTVDTFGRVLGEFGAAGTSSVETSYSYDANGHATTITAPLSRIGLQSFDALNRLQTVTNAASGVFQYGHDALDQVTSFLDPRSLSTSYSRNGLGDLLSVVSPDSGTTTNTYDSGGNRKTWTDARAAVGTFTYDDLNRMLTATYTGGSPTQAITFTYDSGTNAIGKLTGASDASHSLAWVFDAMGRVSSKTQTISTVVKTAGYSHTNGNLTQLTTPSGQVIAYTYSNHDITGVSINGSTLLSSVAYDPFGGAHSWTWGNSTAETRSHNTDGNPNQIGGPEVVTYSYDNAFRITGASNASNSALSWAYGYDGIDRVTSATTTTTTLGWTYDAGNNRLTQTGTAASTFTVPSGSNKLSSVSGALTRTYSYDNSGNTSGYSGNTFTYNNRNRMASAGTTSYLYDAFGQRIEKSGGVSGTVIFVYDEKGHLLGEYSSTGALIEETIWLGDIPVATIQPVTGGGVLAYYIHADHQYAPRTITRASDNVIMWRWDVDPFGTAVPNTNPGGAGAFSYNLRFAGQYYDTESGLNYNYKRDYDSQTGKYVESDPAGLRGGVNTYAYANQSPIGDSDPSGEIAWVPFVVFGVGAVYGGYEEYHTASACLSGWPLAIATGRGAVAGGVSAVVGLIAEFVSENPYVAGGATGLTHSIVNNGLQGKWNAEENFEEGATGMVLGKLGSTLGREVRGGWNFNPLKSDRTWGPKAMAIYGGQSVDFGTDSLKSEAKGKQLCECGKKEQ